MGATSDATPSLRLSCTLVQNLYLHTATLPRRQLVKEARHCRAARVPIDIPVDVQAGKLELSASHVVNCASLDCEGPRALHQGVATSHVQALQLMVYTAPSTGVTQVGKKTHTRQSRQCYTSHTNEYTCLPLPKWRHSVSWSQGRCFSISSAALTSLSCTAAGSNQPAILSEHSKSSCTFHQPQKPLAIPASAENLA